jgi:hypothetical protein
VAIRASASVTAEPIDLAVEKSVKTAFNRSTLSGGALAVEAGRDNRRLSDQQRSDGEMPDCDPFVHRYSSSESRNIHFLFTPAVLNCRRCPRILPPGSGFCDAPRLISR